MVDWITATGERWISEHREIGYEIADDHWVLDFTTRLENVRGRALEFAIGAGSAH